MSASGSRQPRPADGHVHVRSAPHPEGMVTSTAVPATPSAPRGPGAPEGAAPGVEPPPGRGHRGRLAVLGVVVGVVVLRLPFLASPLNTDEAGYLYIGGRWALLSPGRSLYGNYWVDRPPLLITLFGLADRLGGSVPLRLLGIAAIVVAVLAVADTVDHLTRAPREAAARTGVRARLAGWSPGWPAACAALVTAGLLVTPNTAALTVNGEVLAAPFLAVACAATVRALRHPDGHARAALLAGACAAAAVLIKQNLVDGALWGGLITLASIPTVGLRRALRVLALAAVGGLVSLGVVAGWTVLHGTSLVGVYDAMYPFRVASRKFLLAHPGQHVATRQAALLHGAAFSGVLLVTALLVLLVLVSTIGVMRRRERATRTTYAAAVATAGTLVWGGVSIELGGFFWLHYLVQLVVPLGLATGLVAHRWRAVGTVTALAVAVSAVVALALLVRTPLAEGGNPVGRAVGRVAERGDTIITVFGNADVTRASGLDSPYPELWFLPTAVRDHHLDLMTRTVDGPDAPTWFVDLGSTYPDLGRGAPALRAALSRHYHRVAVLQGSGVWLHDGVRRATPVLAG